MGKSSIKIKKDRVIVSVNPKLYSLEVIYSAAYVFLDKAYIILDGSPEKEVFVELKPKNKEDLKKLGMEFFNELINYADYNARAKKTKKIREIILQRALIANGALSDVNQDRVSFKNDKEFEDLLEELESDGEGVFDDSERIAVPWETEDESKNDNKTK